MVSIGITGDNGWIIRDLPQHSGKLYFKGYLHAKSVEQLAQETSALVEIPPSPPFAKGGTGYGVSRLSECMRQISAYLNALDGHFAFVVQTPQWCLAAVDKIASIPLCYADDGDAWHIDCQAARLLANAGIDAREVKSDAALAIAMSGYTIGRATLYDRLQALTPGEAVFFAAVGDAQRFQYYRYAPWHEQPGVFSDYLSELAGVTLNVLRKMLASVGDRQIVIPLSAGNDSRSIASGLKQLGATNVKCFTYGIDGSFEAQISRKVAEKLGYEWRFVPLTHRSESAFYRSEEFRRYWREADSCLSVPYIQGLSATKYLQESGWIDANAVFVNGNTGDFISGGHIPPAMCANVADVSREKRMTQLLHEFVKKHFSLWAYLKTANNLQNIERQLSAEISRLTGENIPDHALHGVYEYLELLGRQSKYILGNQRIYEFYGYEWRLPLWDDDYLRFWAKVPLALKAKQNLYKSMLQQQNWGGVWDNSIPVNRQTIRPKWLIPLRFLAKLGFAPFGAKGRKAWKRFELNVFYYWRDLGMTVALFPYRQVLFDRKGARHVVAFMAERYLAEKATRIRH